LAVNLCVHGVVC